MARQEIIQVETEGDLEDLKRLARGTHIYDQSIRRALNRAATATSTAASKGARTLYNVKATEIRKTFRIQRARRGQLMALVISEGETIPLSRFGARQTKLGVTVRVRKDRSRKRLERAFFGRGPLPSSRLFRREGQSRLPIEQLFGPSIPQMLSNAGVERKILERAEEVYLSTLENDLRFRMEQQLGKAILR